MCKSSVLPPCRTGINLNLASTGFIGKEQTTELAIYKRGRGVELLTSRTNNSSYRSKQDLNPGPTDVKPAPQPLGRAKSKAFLIFFYTSK